MEKLVQILGERQYLAGDFLSLVDFTLFEFTNYAERCTEGKIYETYPALQAHNNMMKELPGVKEFIAAGHEN
jgi:glutathione S-transferase